MRPSNPFHIEQICQNHKRELRERGRNRAAIRRSGAGNAATRKQRKDRLGRTNVRKKGLMRAHPGRFTVKTDNGTSARRR